MLICNLYHYRYLEGLTQEELSSKLNVSNNTISNIELGKFLPSASLIYKILIFFNIGFFDLFYYQDNLLEMESD